jgi:hypothetical protein
MAQPVDTTPDETSFSSAFEQHVDPPTQADTSRPTTSLPLETVSRRLAHRNFRNLMTGSLHHAWNDHTLSPAIDKTLGQFVSQSAKNTLAAKSLSDKAHNRFTNFTLIS